MAVDINAPKPKGWGLADALAEGWTTADVVAFAKPRIVEFPLQALEPPADEPPLPDEAPPEPEPEDRPARKRQEPPREWSGKTETPYYRALGFDSGRYFFFVKATCQVAELSASSMSKSGLLTLAPVEWWAATYPTRNGWDVEGAQNDLIRACEKVGVFDPGIVRGRGAWEDEGRSVLHLGDKLLVDGESADIAEHKTGYVYNRGLSMGLRASGPLKNKAAVDLVELCRLPRWVDAKSGDLLAGWLAVAPVCGALPWRSHAWVTGPAGSGKTWVVTEICKRVLGRFALDVQSVTTEAGVRQLLKSDARPIIFDEAEAESERDKARMQGILNLARQASSEGGAPIVKGSATGHAISYFVRSVFLFSSINPALREYADETRITMFRLRPPIYSSPEEREEAAERFKRMQRMVIELLTDDWRAGLLARMVEMIPVLRHNHTVFAETGARVFGSRRLGDQMASMLAGLYGLHSTKRITEADALRWLEERDWSEQVDLSAESTEQRLIALLMETRTQVQGSGAVKYERTLGEVLLAACGGGDDHITAETAAAHLARIGLRPDGDTVWISNSSRSIAEMLRDTPWASKWSEALLRIEGAEKSGRVIRFATSPARAVGVPLRQLLG